MNDDDSRPQTKPQSETELRRQRQAEALRANLLRRKAQTRARAEEATATRPEVAPGEGLS